MFADKAASAGEGPAIMFADLAVMDKEPPVYQVERAEFAFTPKRWAFAEERRAEIEAFFAALQREKPAVWNGRTLMLYRQVLGDGVLRGDYLETDYASFAAWHRWGRPPAAIHDCFGAAAVLSADGAFLTGVMGAHTFNAGSVYFPCGTPEPSDIVGGKVDLDVSLRRELKEETGFDAADFTPEAGWSVVVDGPLIAVIKVFRSGESAAGLRERVLGKLARQAQPEFSDIRVVRRPADLDPAMPRYVVAFLKNRWRAG